MTLTRTNDTSKTNQDKSADNNNTEKDKNIDNTQLQVNLKENKSLIENSNKQYNKKIKYILQHNITCNVTGESVHRGDLTPEKIY